MDQNGIFQEKKIDIDVLNPLSANPTTSWYTTKQFAGENRRNILVCLTTLWGWRLKG